MSSLARTVKAPPTAVWEVLADGWLYPLWVVGRLPDARGRRRLARPGLAARTTRSAPGRADRRHHRGARVQPGSAARAAGAGLAGRRGGVEIRLTRLRRRTPRSRSRRTRSSGPGVLVPKPLRDVDAATGATSRRCAGWPTSPSAAQGLSAAVTAVSPRRTTPSSSAPDPTGWWRPTTSPTPGWSVLVLEAQPDVGGAVRSARRRPPRLRARHLQRLLPAGGRLADHPVLRPRGARPGLAARAGGARPPPAATGAGRCCTATARSPPGCMDDAAPRRRRRLAARCARSGTGSATHLVGALLTPFPPVRPGLAALARLRRSAGLDFVKTLLTPASRPGPRSASAATSPRLLLAGNAGHADIPLDAPGSGLMGLLMSMLGQTVGFPVPEGGAGRARPGAGPAAASRAAARSGATHEVVRIDVDAAAGRPASAPRRRAVRAPAGRSWPTSPPRNLYGGLLGRRRPARAGSRRAMRSLPARPVHGQGRLGARRAGPVGRRRRRTRPGTVHVADSVEEMTEALGQVAAGCDPRAPVPARRPDDDHRPDPLAGRHRVDLGLHPRPAAGRARRRRRRHPRRLGPTTTASGSPTGCRPGSSGSRRASARGSWPGGSSDRASSRPATPT